MSEFESLYNADELIAPAWLNNEFLQNILIKKYDGASLEVTKVTITPGTTKSDHYGSVMFRARINYTLLPAGTEKVQSLIVKTAPTMEGEKKELLKNYTLFETEIKMYTETLPKIQSILRQHGDNTKIYAEVFYHSLTPLKCIIFEDLVELGYTIISKRHCNMDEVKAALLKLAKIHAVSYKLAQEQNTSITDYQDGLFSDEKILEFNFVKDGLKLFKENLERYDDLRPYLSHIEKIEADIFKRIIQSFNAYKNGKRDGIFVLNHGDFHMKNIMIKKMDTKLEDLMLVDFQISVFGSPAIDVIYALIMLFSEEMRREHRDEMIYYYFSNFQNTLRLIGLNGRIPTMIDFQKELLANGHWEVFLTTSFLLINHVFPDPTADLAKFIEDENYRRKLWQRDDITQELRVLLPFYLHRGYFEN